MTQVLRAHERPPALLRRVADLVDSCRHVSPAASDARPERFFFCPPIPRTSERRRVMTTTLTLMPANTPAPTTVPNPGTVHAEATHGEEVTASGTLRVPQDRAARDLGRAVRDRSHRAPGVGASAPRARGAQGQRSTASCAACAPTAEPAHGRGVAPASPVPVRAARRASGVSGAAMASAKARMRCASRTCSSSIMRPLNVTTPLPAALASSNVGDHALGVLDVVVGRARTRRWPARPAPGGSASCRRSPSRGPAGPRPRSPRGPSRRCRRRRG